MAVIVGSLTAIAVVVDILPIHVDVSHLSDSWAPSFTLTSTTPLANYGLGARHHATAQQGQLVQAEVSPVGWWEGAGNEAVLVAARAHTAAAVLRADLPV